MKHQVHELTDAELISRYAELKEELFNLRFRQATNQLENPKALNTTKKDIARILTEAKLRNVDVKAKVNKVAKKTKKTTKKPVAKAEKTQAAEKPVKTTVKKTATKKGEEKVDAIEGVMTYGKK